MRHDLLRITILCCLSLVALFASLIESEPSQYSFSLSSNGLIKYWPTIDVTINASQVIGINSLSLGCQLGLEWKAWSDSPTRRELARNANFKIIRFFDFRPTAPRLMPCIYWNEANETGTWNWTNVDSFVQAIFDIGAEPLICLGWVHSNCSKTLKYIPAGMALDPTTQLPYPNSYSKYCAEWVKHFETKGLPVRYYEIFNEPWTYFGWAKWENLTKLENFKILWNSCAKAMRTENSAVKLSFDFITAKRVLDFWLKNGGESVDFLDFHKYDCWSTSGDGYFNDTDLLMMAERERFETIGYFYGVNDAQQVWFNTRGSVLPVICSESNLNSAWQNGADPRIKEMTGAVWAALVLRKAVLEGLSYYTYFNFGEGGFGMIDFNTDKPWYTYYAHQMIGNNLAVADEIVESTSNSDDLRVLSWIHDGTVMVLIICKVDEPRTICVHGLEGELRVIKIDNNIPLESAILQTHSLSAGDPLIISGYTVALLQTYNR